MRIVLASPYLDALRGNALTAKRLINNLQDNDIFVIGIAYNELVDANYHQITEIINSDFIHILNPVRYLESEMYKQKMHNNKNYGITFTGTDINVHLTDTNVAMVELLENASFLVVFHEQAFDVFVRLFPKLVSKVHVISQGYYEIEYMMNSESHSQIDKFRQAHGQYVLDYIVGLQNLGNKIIVLPAGIRKIKQIPWAIEAVSNYRERYKQQVVICIIGEKIEAEEMDIVVEKVETNSSAEYFGDVPHNFLLKIIEQSDIVLNCSLSEGQSIAIIEAFYQKTLVIASKCPGNEQMIEHGRNGYLFDNEEDFFLVLNETFENYEKTEEMIQTAYQWGLVKYSAEHETNLYLQLYKQTLEFKSEKIVTIEQGER